jgi:hypothetical protein
MQTRMPAEKFLDGRALVLIAAVPQEHHVAAKMLEQLSQKLGRQGGVDVFPGMESGVERQAPPTRRYRKGRDGRYLLPVAGAAQNRGLPLRSPGPTNVGNEEKAALVEKDEMGPQSFGLFLYAATGNASNARWLSRPSPWPWSWASGRTSPGRAKASRHGRGDSALQSAAGSPPRFGPGSRGPWRIRRPRRCARESAGAFASESRIASVDAQEPGWVSTPACRSCGNPATTERHCSRSMPGRGQRRKGIGLLSATLRPSGVASPAVGLFQGVSCPIE